ncbi:MAG: ABC transporter permease subunit [Candidatus Thermofonsia bacterium]|nr:MAG: ABC transporter permease subunit [Candidatus Thermofonsia bacterium]
MAAIIALPFGGWLGHAAGSILSNWADQVSSQTIVGLGAFVVSSVGIVPLMRLALPGSLDEKRPSLPITLLAITASLLLGIFSLSLLADLGLVAGGWLRDNLGLFAFIGNFIYVLSDLLRVLMPAAIGFIGAAAAASYASRYGQEAILQLSRSAGQTVTLILTTIGTAVFIFAIEYFINWICLFELCNLLPQTIPDLWVSMGIPAIVIGLIAGALSMRQEPKRPFPIGALTYNATRSFLNGTRSIEPVLLGFVLVVWVGLGPFAGILALTISSIADLGKLFSEQVENISQGPIEAITATGANRLQTIVYAVIPQIVPHYIAFAFYRWDINVRMATIIGFVGGGGIGFVLFRSTNLTQYRAASVMVIAIALVVTTLDYVSSKIRSRII